MKNKLAVWVSLFLLACGSVSSAASQPAADEKAVRAAAGQFYSALNKMFAGDLGEMTEVWSHADDVTYMGPGGGFQVGWAQVLESWKAQAAMKLGGSVKAADL